MLILKYEIKNIGRLIELVSEEETRLAEEYSDDDLMDDIWTLISALTGKKTIVV